VVLAKERPRLLFSDNHHIPPSSLITTEFPLFFEEGAGGVSQPLPSSPLAKGRG